MYTEGTMSDLSAFYGPNAGYVLELYDRYVEDASAVGDDWQQFFASFDPGMLEAAVTESRQAPESCHSQASTVGRRPLLVSLTGLPPSVVVTFGHVWSRGPLLPSGEKT